MKSMDQYDIYHDKNIDVRCIDVINGMKTLLPLKLNFSNVEFAGFEVDDPGKYDEEKSFDCRGWKFTLRTYIWTDYEERNGALDRLHEGEALNGLEWDKLEKENRRTVRRKYEVCWQFCDRWGNQRSYSLNCFSLQGPLNLECEDYGEFQKCNFRILLVPSECCLIPGAVQWGDYFVIDDENKDKKEDSQVKFLFEFRHPDLIRVKSYRLLGEEELTCEEDEEESDSDDESNCKGEE